MELSFWAATDVGKKREINEDNFLVDKKLSLFVVADGMGGHASGEVASHVAVHEFRTRWTRATIRRAPRERRRACARRSAGDARAAVRRRAGHLPEGVKRAEKRGMGTTTRRC
jgi:serine/threonine protein phosphatase PrpC